MYSADPKEGEHHQLEQSRAAFTVAVACDPGAVMQDRAIAQIHTIAFGTYVQALRSAAVHTISRGGEGPDRTPTGTPSSPDGAHSRADLSLIHI